MPFPQSSCSAARPGTSRVTLRGHPATTYASFIMLLYAILSCCAPWACDWISQSSGQVIAFRFMGQSWDHFIRWWVTPTYNYLSLWRWRGSKILSGCHCASIKWLISIHYVNTHNHFLPIIVYITFAQSCKVFYVPAWLSLLAYKQKLCWIFFLLFSASMIGCKTAPLPLAFFYWATFSLTPKRSPIYSFHPLGTLDNI